MISSSQVCRISLLVKTYNCEDFRLKIADLLFTEVARLFLIFEMEATLKARSLHNFEAVVLFTYMWGR